VNRKTKEEKLSANPSMVRMDLDLERNFAISADSLDSLKAKIHKDAQVRHFISASVLSSGPLFSDTEYDI
jgi:hypothetical protein